MADDPLEPRNKTSSIPKQANGEIRISFCCLDSDKE